MTRDKLMELAARVEAGGDVKLDEEAAVALGWKRRRVGSLGLKGRTSGSYFWFPPNAPFATKGRRKPPRFSGPKMKRDAAACLRAIAEDETK